MIKPNLTGSQETMLQSFYARVKYSLGKSPLYYDDKAVEIIKNIDYDFSLADKDMKMNKGVIARTLVFDELVNDYIKKYPKCTIVNIACGLDTRFYRVDNGNIQWYNLDVEETILLRNQLFNESERIKNIGISVLDKSWCKFIDKSDHNLFIIEGLSMYFTKDEVKQMLDIINNNFDDATIMMECLAKKWVNKESIEKSISSTGAKFIFGADCFDDIKDIAIGYKKVKDDDITRGMIKLMPILNIFKNCKFIKKMTQKILIFKKDA